MNDPIQDDASRLSAELAQVRQERDRYRAELESLRSASDGGVPPHLQLVAQKLSEQVQEKFYSLLTRLGWAAGLIGAIVTLGGVVTFSDILTKRIDDAVAEREADVSRVRQDIIQAFVDLKLEAAKALEEIKSAKSQVAEESEQARIDIRSRVGAVVVSGDSQTSTITIPVVVHVVYGDSRGNISDAQVKSQIDVLNEDFGARNADRKKVPPAFLPAIGNPNIQFTLATTDPAGRPTDGITRTRTTRKAFSANDDVKSARTGGENPWSSSKYLNIWVCDLVGGLLGLSQFPGGPASSDGVVINNVAFGTMGTAQAPFNRGRTTTNQVAKYLNLKNLWGDTTDCSGDDGIADTPIQQSPNFGTPTFPRVSCNNGPNGDMFMNFLDYVDDDAMYMFTKGQVSRMRETLNGTRRSLWRP
jgi:Pregnancy-associated plasma protein-A